MSAPPDPSASGLPAFSLALAFVLAPAPGFAGGGPEGDRALGEYLSAECVTCHQTSGRFDGIPPIVGWPEDAFFEVMNAYRLKERANPVMQTIAGRLSDEEIAALAAYFASLASPPQQSR